MKRSRLEDMPPEIQVRAKKEYWFEQANIPRAMWSLDWDRFDYSNEVGDAAYLVLETAERLAYEDGDHRGVSIFGHPGRGKTALACTMLCSIIEAQRPRTIGGLFDRDVPGYFITMSDYHSLYLKLYELSDWSKKAPAGHEDAYWAWEENHLLRRFIEEEVRHLVLDDVGNEHQTASGAVADAFHKLIRGRFSKGLSTSITSNLSQEGFTKMYGKPQASYLKEATTIIRLPGKDFRDEEDDGAW